MRIQWATPEHADQIAMLEVELFDNAMPPAMLAREIEFGWGLVIGNPVEAYALVRANGNLLDLTRLGVTAASRQKGYGKALLEEVLRLGMPVCLTVLKSNAVALRLYKKYGFKIVGHLPADNAWLMATDRETSTAPHSPDTE